MNKYNLLKIARKKHGYSLEAVENTLAIDYGLKLHKTNIARYEKGEVKKPDAKYLKAMCKIYGMDYIDFFKEIGLVDESLQVEEINKMEVEIVEIPVYGKASAGNGYLNMGNIKRYEKIAKLPHDNLPIGVYGVEIDGESMYPTLCDGDLGIIDPCCEKYNLNNKICVVFYEGETFIKRLRIEKSFVVLMSDNSNRVKYKDIIITEGDEFECCGVLIERRTKFV